jgi:hypothetical protein
MLATGQVVGSVLVYLGAQLIQLGLVSFIFNQCKEKLLSIVWFAHLYAYFQHLHDWADEQVRPLKQRAAALMSELRVYAAAHLGKAGSGMMRHISLLWARMRKH